MSDIERATQIIAELLALHEAMMAQTNHRLSFYTASTINMMNTVPGKALLFMKEQHGTR